MLAHYPTEENIFFFSIKLFLIQKRKEKERKNTKTLIDQRVKIYNGIFKNFKTRESGKNNFRIYHINISLLHEV